MWLLIFIEHEHMKHAAGGAWTTATMFFDRVRELRSWLLAVIADEAARIQARARGAGGASACLFVVFLFVEAETLFFLSSTTGTATGYIHVCNTAVASQARC